MKFKTLLTLACTLGSIGANAQLCLPSFIFGCAFDQINTFTVNGINSTFINTANTGCGTNAYTDYTAQTPVSFSPGGTYSATINSGIATGDNAQVFIDFDDDDNFVSSESVGGMNNIADILSTISTFSIAIPAGATPGLHTMRVVVSGDGIYPNIISCPDITDLYGGGEVHDYKANITGSNCDTPTNLAASAVTFDGATFNWTAVTGATGYQYALNTSPTPPGSGTAITLLTYTGTGLMSNTTYYFHLRTACNSQFSAWITISFTTSACPVPTGVTQSAVTATTATVSWTAISGAQGYQYAVNTSMTPPTTGTYTTLNSVPVTGLTANTTYHTWVRTVCGQADTSGWNPMHMWTTLPVSVVNVGNDGFRIEVYPNPVKNSLHLAALGKDNGMGRVELTDVTGKVVNTYTLEGKEMNIDMSGLSSGVYFIRYMDNEHRSTVKVSKE